MIVTILGAGSMADAIGIRALAGGHTVRIIHHDGAKADTLAGELRLRASDVANTSADAVGAGVEGVQGADLVVLALPYPATKEVAATYGDRLDGAVLVDISNPVDFSTFDSLAVPAGSSAAEELAATVPAARVVKAFNTTFATTVAAGEVAGLPLDVLIAGDDQAAKTTVGDLASSSGLRPLDVGPLRRARELEGFQFLHMAVQDRLDLRWSSAIKILP